MEKKSNIFMEKYFQQLPTDLQINIMMNIEHWQIPPPKYKIGDGLLIKNGNDLTIFCSGNITEVVMDVRNKLKSNNINAKIVSLICLKPINSKSIISQISSKNVVTIEEHSEMGGLGTAIAEILMNNKLSHISFQKIALQDRCHKEIGSHNYLRKLNGLDSDSIVKKIIGLIKK